MMCSGIGSNPVTAYLKYPCYATEAIFYTGVAISVATIAAACLLDKDKNMSIPKSLDCKKIVSSALYSIALASLVTATLVAYIALTNIYNKY